MHHVVDRNGDIDIARLRHPAKLKEPEFHQKIHFDRAQPHG
jgi:hypothetical protein